MIVDSEFDGAAANLFTSIRDALGSNLDRDTGCAEVLRFLLSPVTDHYLPASFLNPLHFLLRLSSLVATRPD
jgi:hypothetical protein